MTSERLTYHPVARASLDEFHRLVQDEHVRHFLLDGTLYPLEWSEARIQESERLFERRGVGLWLAYGKGEAPALVGFCGFLEIPSIPLEPQLVYAANVASVRVLEKLGFRQVGMAPGRAGHILLMALEAAGASSTIASRRL